jgi:hypothetical protein
MPSKDPNDLDYPQGGDTSDETADGRPLRPVADTSGKPDPKGTSRDGSKDHDENAPLDEKLAYNDR